MSERNGGSNPREKPGSRPNPWPVIVIMAMICLTVVAVVYIVAG